MATSPLYLLDTNILIHAVRSSPTWHNVIKPTCDPLMVGPRPIISIVTEGELLSFAEQRQWAPSKRHQVGFFLTNFVRISLDAPGILAAYAMIDAYSRDMCQIKMGKNDLWLAATAVAFKAMVVTTDNDFNHLHTKGILQRTLIAQQA